MLIEIVGTDVKVDEIVYECKTIDEAIKLVVWLDRIDANITNQSGTTIEEPWWK